MASWIPTLFDEFFTEHRYKLWLRELNLRDVQGAALLSTTAEGDVIATTADDLLYDLANGICVINNRKIETTPTLSHALINWTLPETGYPNYSVGFDGTSLSYHRTPFSRNADGLVYSRLDTTGYNLAGLYNSETSDSSRMVVVLPDNTLAVKSIGGGGGSDWIAPVTGVIGGVIGAIGGIIFGKKVPSLGGLFDGLFGGSSTPSVPKVQVSDDKLNVMLEGSKKAGEYQLEPPDNFDVFSLGKYADRTPSYEASGDWTMQYNTLRQYTTTQTYSPPANTLLNQESTVRFLSHQNGIVTTLGGRPLAQHLSHALSLDQDAVSHLLFTAGIVIGGAADRFGRVEINIVDDEEEEGGKLILPPGESYAISNTPVSDVTGASFAMLLPGGRTGAIPLSRQTWIPSDVLSFSSPRHPSFTFGVRFPATAGLNLAGYGSVVLGHNSGPRFESVDYPTAYGLNVIVGANAAPHIHPQSFGSVIIGGGALNTNRPVNQFSNSIFIGSGGSMPNVTAGSQQVAHALYLGAGDVTVQSNRVVIGSQYSAYTRIRGIATATQHGGWFVTRNASGDLTGILPENTPFQLKSEMGSFATTAALLAQEAATTAQIATLTTAQTATTAKFADYMPTALLATTFMPRVEVYTRTETDNAFASAGSVWTREEADNRYALVSSSGITQTAADARYAPKATTYSKSQVDSIIENLAPGGTITVDAYTKSQSDSRYYQRGIANTIPYDAVSSDHSGGTVFSNTARWPSTAGGNLARTGGGNDGIQNTLIGFHAGASMTTGYSNTFVGRNAGDGCVSGFQNVWIGRRTNATGAFLHYNVAIGAGVALAAECSNAIAIGYNVSAGNGEIKIGGANATGGTYLQGVRQHTSTDDLVVTVSSSNRLGARSLTSAVTALAYPRSYVDEQFYTKLGAAEIFRRIDDSFSKVETTDRFRLKNDSFSSDECNAMFRRQDDSYSRDECDQNFRLVNDSYSTQQADQTFRRADESYDRVESDSRYVPRSQVLNDQSPGGMKADRVLMYDSDSGQFTNVTRQFLLELYRAQLDADYGMPGPVPSNIDYQSQIIGPSNAVALPEFWTTGRRMSSNSATTVSGNLICGRSSHMGPAVYNFSNNVTYGSHNWGLQSGTMTSCTTVGMLNWSGMGTVAATNTVTLGTGCMTNMRGPVSDSIVIGNSVGPTAVTTKSLTNSILIGAYQ